MTTSGSYDFTRTRDQIIYRAFRIATQTEDDPTPNEVVDIAEALESYVKTLQDRHIHLWTREWVQKTLMASSEVTGTDASVYTCISSHTSASATRPITGANYSSRWYARGSTGGVWATSTAYANIGEFTCDADTLGIEDMFVRHDNNDTPINPLTYEEYLAKPSKHETGLPNEYVFYREITPQVFLCPIPDATDYVIHYLRWRKLEDFDSGSNNPDMPENWINPLTWALAAEIGPEFGVPIQRQSYLDTKATALMEKARESDVESTGSVFIQLRR
jgi:hypothetical protein